MTYCLHAGYRPGAIGRIAELHGAYYHRHAGLGVFFEGKVAKDLAEFCERYAEGRDGLWLALADDAVEGSIAIDGARADADGARLRWFIVADRLRGGGVGTALMATALDFCRARNYRRIHLSTFAGLDAARHLYEKFGFRLIRQERGTQWGAPLDEQVFELRV